MKTNLPHGQFLVIEGPDGAGKTTQMEMLEKHIQSFGVEVLRVREPGGTVLGEGIRTLFKSNFGQTDPVAEVLLLLAARQQLTVEVILPALRRGAWVLADRHTPSTFAYQGAGQGLGFSRIIELREGLGSNNHIADMTVIMTISPEERARRLGDRTEGLDKLDMAGDAFIKRVADAYDEMVDGNWSLGIGQLRKVDGDGTPEEVHERIKRAFFWQLNELRQAA